MKKFLVLLLIVTLAAFVFVGCDLIPSEGEGEGEGEVEDITIVIEGAYEKSGYTYVQDGKSYDITVTFPAPEKNVIAYFNCEGDYDDFAAFLVPNADKTVWTGKVKMIGQDFCDVCYLWVEWGMCTDCYTGIPVIVDSESPYASFEVSVKDCVCEGCEVIFKSLTEAFACDPDELCCGDDCSGLAGWAINIFDKEPFDKCCAASCYEPKFTCSGTDCPIECTVSCLDTSKDYDSPYYLVIDLEDNVGNTTRYCYELFFGSVDDCKSLEIGPYVPTKPQGGDTQEICGCSSPICGYQDYKWYIGDEYCCPLVP